MVKSQQKAEDIEIEDSSLQEVSKKKVKAKKPKSPRGLHPMPAILRIPCVVLFLTMAAWLFTFFILYRTNSCSLVAMKEFVRSKPTVTAYNFLIVFSLLAVLTAITWRPFLSFGIFFCAISVITFIHIQKFQLRAEPLLPEEFQLADAAGDLIKFVDIGEIYKLVAGVILILIGSCLAEYYIRKFVGKDKSQMPLWESSAIVPRLTFTMSGLAMLMAVANPIIQRQNYDWTEANFLAWNQADNYAENGFIIGFLYNMGKATIPAPTDYSESEMQKIAEKYTNMKLADTTRKDWVDEVDNVIIILAETFYDPELLKKYYDHYGGDITPNLHKIFQEYPSGYMYSPEYGGGTANVEFEIQTGLSNFWVQSYPYVNLVSKLEKLYGAANWGKTFGYETTAVHSYNSIMYKRSIVYPILGYNDFIDSSKMKYQEHEFDSPLINDRSIYNEIIDILKSSDEPQMIGAVTMQNHSPYAQSLYPELDFPLKDKVITAYDIESNFQSLHTSDQYLGEFLDKLDKLDERTVVLWFGDHAMGMLDKYKNSDDKNDQDTARFTPYFIYANFDIESLYTVKEVADMNAKLGFKFNNIRGVNLPTTTPNCLQNTLYDVLNIQKPALMYLVDQVCQETPVLAPVYFAGASPTLTTALHEYELVNYDMLLGKQYWNGY